MKNSIKMGVIGLGARGTMILKDVLLPMEDVEVIAVCDVYEDRINDAIAMTKEHNHNLPLGFADYRELLKIQDLEAVYIATSWQTHFEIAAAALEAGVPVACDVGGAFSLNEIWKLVRTYENTKTPCMFMENCCYGRDEMMLMNMRKKGVFGEIVHCAGGYHHDLRNEVSFGRENRHYRLDNYLHRNCENYPTHEIGPITRLLDINRGNAMVSLTSTSSKSAGLHQYILEHKAEDQALRNAYFAQGDVVTTVIRCANGETITITLDTTLPGAYSRGLIVKGTKAMFMEDNRSLFIDGVHTEFEWKWHEQYQNIEQYRKEYEHPLWNSFLNDGVKGGHGGMDWLVFQDFIDALKNKKSMPIDVYDMASWSVISLLSEQSIALGSQPVAFPDFTDGKWITRKPVDR